MLSLALRSLRHRATAFVASFLAMLLGAVMIMSFASMLDTAGGTGVSDANVETLVTMASVVGGWSLILVLFAVTSTLSLAVRQRATEMALLKSIGATPAQLRRMILGETAVLAVAAVALAVLPGMLGGRALLALLIDTEQVAPDVTHVFGPAALSMGCGITFVAAVGSAVLTARRTTGLRVTESLMDATAEPRRMSRKRLVGGIVFLLLAADLAVVTATVMHGEGSDAMQTAGQTSIWASIGFALLGPVLVRRVAGLPAAPLERFGGAAGHLTVQNVRQRAHQMAGALMPIILFTGIATGTLYMQDVDSAAIAAEGLLKNDEQKSIETLNFVVIGMVVLFAAIMLINTLVATTTYRRGEFGRQRLTGATPGQVLAMVTLESAVLTVTGVLFGAVASLFTILPFTFARTDTVLPDSGPGTFLAIVAVAAVLTMAASLATAVRALRIPAIEAAAV
ncbi:putative ABC transport system permease protein [Thermomonospora echinospora]|uniref:Putative ABC transport system permease protein n=1 Tax=Thermomonospora echinospora TaxID=1992 RepID=A0A1H6CA17_9ACTN|nr:FtsX-like permease family protein [Thermomonospora echinospora]SEG69752.1 putative ABC transport system permease protein [Thermomonospora echinospora]